MGHYEASRILKPFKQVGLLDAAAYPAREKGDFTDGIPRSRVQYNCCCKFIKRSLDCHSWCTT